MIKAGFEIVGATSGTAGGFVCANKTLAPQNVPAFLVSAAHVLCPDPFNCSHGGIEIRAGDRVIASHLEGLVATSSGFDVGLAALSSQAEVIKVEVPDLNSTECQPTGDIADQIYDEAHVWKFGSATGLTRGTVRSVGTVSLKYADGWHELSVGIVTPRGCEVFSRPGDSGSFVFYQTGIAVGIVIGGWLNEGLSYIVALAPALHSLRFPGSMAVTNG
jgi:hypothetical protein